MISVVIPLYNKESTITETLSSVLRQSFNDFEVIIVNDGSTDNSLSMVHRFEDPRIRIIDKENGGVSSARNVGIKNSKYEYIAFLDADDFWYEDHLETIRNLILKYPSKNVGGYGTRFEKRNELIFPLPAIDHKSKKNYLVEDYFHTMSSPQPLFNSSSLTVRKSAAIQVGLFNEKLTYMEDVEFWYRLFSENSLVMSDKKTVIYFTGAENRSNVKSIPLEKRFYGFEYSPEIKHKFGYLDKILAISILDYLNLKDYNNLLHILSRYWRRIPGMIRYYIRLFGNRFK